MKISSVATMTNMKQCCNFRCTREVSVLVNIETSALTLEIESRRPVQLYKRTVDAQGNRPIDGIDVFFSKSPGPNY
jgi:hypothetical protein